MEATIKVEKTVQLTTLEVFANVRYWEDATINGVRDENEDLTPCKKGDLWCPIIEIDSGQITNWVKGTVADIHFKVCDQCAWGIKDENGQVLLKSEGDYVPGSLSPKENGYGDYIIMDIDADGFIKDWDFNISDFTENEED